MKNLDKANFLKHTISFISLSYWTKVNFLLIPRKVFLSEDKLLTQGMLFWTLFPRAGMSWIFALWHLQPALNVGLVEMTIPDKPRSSKQKYRLTDKGKEWVAGNLPKIYRCFWSIYRCSITESWDSIHIIAFFLREIGMLSLELKWLSRLNELKY